MSLLGWLRNPGAALQLAVSAWFCGLRVIGVGGCVERRVFSGWGVGVKTEDSRTTALCDVEIRTATNLILRTLLTGSGAGLAELLEGTLFLLEASTELIGCERKGMSRGELWQALVTEGRGHRHHIEAPKIL